MKMIKPTLEELNAIDLSEKVKLLNGHPDGKYFNLPAGREHYRLLHWLAGNVEDVIEFGTFRGLGTLALYNQTIVVSYDIEDHDKALWFYQIHDKIFLNIYDGNPTQIDFKGVDLIFLDTNHDGVFEKQLIDHLTAIKWKGIVVCDDIHWNDQMEEFWTNIVQRKEDWTDIGHWSGTGIIYFE